MHTHSVSVGGMKKWTDYWVNGVGFLKIIDWICCSSIKGLMRLHCRPHLHGNKCMEAQHTAGPPLNKSD